MSQKTAEARGAEPLLRLVAWAVSGIGPDVTGYAPALAIPAVLEKAGLTLDDIDLIDLNEAFAAQVVAVIRDAGLGPKKTNVDGGAHRAGSPGRATGAILTIKLMRALERIDCCRGIVTMCIGGGQRHGSHLRTTLTPKAASTLMGDVGVGRLGIGNMAAGLDDLPLIVYSLCQTKAQETTSMTPTPLTEARNRLSEIVDEVTTTGSEVVITRHGRPAAVVIGYEEYESLIETLNILSDTETMKALAEAEDDLAAGNLVEL